MTKQDIAKLALQLNVYAKINPTRTNARGTDMYTQDKIREFEKIEEEDNWKESILQRLIAKLKTKVI
ncbi:MAG: hypothetical protein FJ354_00875 [Thaumarchaeota archaeon]|nr:hypothetical protein [Nitrososphaerota archaeon]